MDSIIITIAITVLPVMVLNAHADDTPQSEKDITDQQEGMTENLEDSVADQNDKGRLDWLKEGLRVILPENLQDMHRFEVKHSDSDEIKAADNGNSEVTDGEQDPLAADKSNSSSDESAAPVLLDATDKVMEASRKPLMFIQERVPFLTKRDIIFFGRLELDAVHYGSGVLEDDSGLELRRFRLGLAGNIARWSNWNYKFEMDLTDGENTLSDAYLSWHTQHWGTFRVGNQQVAQTLSGRTSSISIPLMERPLPILAFSLDRRLGIGYEFHSDKGGVLATIFAADVNKSVGAEGYALRAYYNPSKHLSHVLHLGMSFVRFASSNDAQIRARPESNLTDTRLINTGVYRDVDASTATGLELAGAWGPVTIRSEFYLASWVGKESTQPRFDGWYAEGSWFLTGEMSRYVEGKFIRPRIRSERGAWELALRYSETDLNDENVTGGWEKNASLGVNWYSKVNWRIMGNVIKVKSDGPQGSQDPWIIQTRVQYYF